MICFRSNTGLICFGNYGYSPTAVKPKRPKLCREISLIFKFNLVENKLRPIWVSLTLAVTFVVLVFGLSETRHLVSSLILRRHFAQALQLLLVGLVLLGIFGFGFRGIWPWADLDTELDDSALLMGCGFIFSRRLIFFEKSLVSFTHRKIPVFHSDDHVNLAVHLKTSFSGRMNVRVFRCWGGVSSNLRH